MMQKTMIFSTRVKAIALAFAILLQTSCAMQDAVTVVEGKRDAEGTLDATSTQNQPKTTCTPLQQSPSQPVLTEAGEATTEPAADAEAKQLQAEKEETKMIAEKLKLARGGADDVTVTRRRLLRRRTRRRLIRARSNEHPMDRQRRRLLEQNRNSHEHPVITMDRLKRMKRRLLQQNRY